MDTLDILVNSINKLENYTAKYIYIKYIETNESLDTTETSTTEASSTETSTAEASTTETTETKFKYSKKPKNTIDYTLFLNRIFSKERKHIIKQSDVITHDLENMTLADEEYEKNPNSFHRQKNNSYPDIKRCSYIRKHKNKLMRCKNSIINDAEEMCTKHDDRPNMYWTMYVELLEKMNTE
jgi:hypothetical protein